MYEKRHARGDHPQLVTNPVGPVLVHPAAFVHGASSRIRRMLPDEGAPSGPRSLAVRFVTIRSCRITGIADWNRSHKESVQALVVTRLEPRYQAIRGSSSAKTAVLLLETARPGAPVGANHTKARESSGSHAPRLHAYRVAHRRRHGRRADAVGATEVFGPRRAQQAAGGPR